MLLAGRNFWLQKVVFCFLIQVGVGVVAPAPKSVSLVAWQAAACGEGDRVRHAGLTHRLPSRVGLSSERETMEFGRLSPASFVPNCVLQRHAELLLNAGEPSEPATPSSSSGSLVPMPLTPGEAGSRVCSQGVDFVLVILDVSGFTKISGWLQKHRGSEGPELMSAFLSQYFHRMVDIVSFFGGDVLKFAGDALLIKFCSSPTHLRTACICAATAVEQLNNYVLPGDVPHTLSLHAAVDIGKGEEMFVGGVRGRWEHCISGPVFRHIGAVLDEAPAGTVLVSAAVQKLLEQVQKEDPEQGFCVMPVERQKSIPGPVIGRSHKLFRVQVCTSSLRYGYKIDEHDTALPATSFASSPGASSSMVRTLERPRRYEALATLPVPLSNKELQLAVKRYCLPNVDSIISSVFSAEMREVATMFCLLPTYFCGGGCAELYQQIVVAFQVQLSKHDGRLRQFLTDDKGTVLIGCFGLPGTSTISRELRAVRAAVGLRRATRLLHNTQGFEEIHIGISAGLVYCGNIGDTSRCEYCVVGDSVNMAARLMGLASKTAAATKAAKSPTATSPNLGKARASRRRRARRKAKRHECGGIIYCDANIRRAIHTRETTAFQIGEGFDVKVKGKKEMMKCFAIIDRKEPTTAIASQTRKSARLSLAVVPTGLRMQFMPHSLVASVFVGRDAQLDMANMILSARPRLSTFVFFSGGKGMGKSTMLHRVAQSAKVMNYKVAQAFPNLAPESGDALSYATVRSWLQQLFSLDGTLCMQTYIRCTSRQQYLLRKLQNQTSENPLPRMYAATMKSARAMTITEVGDGSDTAEVAGNAPVTVSQINDLMVALFKHLFQLLGNRVVLTIDDMEYVDVESLKFLQKFLTQTDACPIIMATRGDDDAHVAHSRVDTRAEMRAVAKAVNCKFEFQLVRLAREACVDLIRRIFAESSAEDDPFGVAIVDDSVVDFIFTRSAGNPLYIHEMIKFVLGRKQVALSRDDGETLVWRMSRTEDMEGDAEPDGGFSGADSGMHGELRDILLGRVEDCSFDARSTLKTAAVIGKYFSQRELQALVPDKSPDTLSMELDELVNAQIIVEQQIEESASDTEDDSPNILKRRSRSDSFDSSASVPSAMSGISSVHDEDDVVYSFIHSSMYETVYSLLLGKHRRRMHREFAEYLENAGADPLLVVFHFERSDKPIGALRPYLRWGTRLSQLSEIPRSISVFERATSIVDDMIASKKSRNEEIVKTPIVCEYATVYLQIMVKLLQQRVAAAAMTGQKGSIKKLHQKLNLFMDEFEDFVANEEILRVLSVGMWVTLFSPEYEFEVFAASSQRLLERAERHENPIHRTRAVCWKLLCDHIAEDLNAQEATVRELETLFFAHEDPSEASHLLAASYGTCYDITSLVARRQYLVLQGKLREAHELWHRLEPHQRKINSGPLSAFCAY